MVADLPGVGSNLQDHLAVSLSFMDKTKSTLSYLTPKGIVQNIRVLEATVKYKLTGKGPLSNNVSYTFSAHIVNINLRN